MSFLEGWLGYQEERDFYFSDVSLSVNLPFSLVDLSSVCFVSLSFFRTYIPPSSVLYATARVSVVKTSLLLLRRLAIALRRSLIPVVRMKIAQL